MSARPLVTIYNEKNESSGNHVKLPAVFRTGIRPDIVSFVHDQIQKNKRQPYAVSTKAGIVFIVKNKSFLILMQILYKKIIKLKY